VEGMELQKLGKYMVNSHGDGIDLDVKPASTPLSTSCDLNPNAPSCDIWKFRRINGYNICISSTQLLLS